MRPSSDRTCWWFFNVMVMKKIKFSKKFGRGLTESELSSLDEKLGRTVPIEIRELLAQANGGYPKRTIFPIADMKDNADGEIRFFYGVDQTPHHDLAWALENYEGRMPGGLFVFACNDSGDEICFVVEGPRAGQVVFWDSYGEGKKPTWKNVYKIANSFDEFLGSLTEYTDD